jgi:outer membrane receptor protein involved in Fe transport
MVGLRSILVGAASASALCAAGGMASAQTADDGDSDVIVVTAQRRAADLQDVPTAVTAISAEVFQ